MYSQTIYDDVNGNRFYTGIDYLTNVDHDCYCWHGWWHGVDRYMEQKVVLITGCSSVIGRAMATDFLGVQSFFSSLSTSKLSACTVALKFNASTAVLTDSSSGSNSSSANIALSSGYLPKIFGFLLLHK
jgi:hypothetical protein